MLRYALVVFVLGLFALQNAAAYCCIQPREPCVYSTCGCPETPAGIVTCNYCNSCNSCNIPYSTTACSTCPSCFRDTKNPCCTCPEKPSPVCSCLQKVDNGCCCSSRIYFPEVEYPNTCYEMTPFFFANCWNY